MQQQRTHSPPSWDPQQYQRFRAERSRPFFDLLSHVPDGQNLRVVDLGCGTGELTATLLARWPDAIIWGVDHSAEMLVTATQLPVHPQLHFVQADIATWQPDTLLDRIISNAALHWIPDHERLLTHLATLLAPGGVLAVQMPANFDASAHRLLAEVITQGPWTSALNDWNKQYGIQSAAWYVDVLSRLGFTVGLWETIYYQMLTGPDAVLEWMKGTTLRPMFSRLNLDDQKEFLSLYGGKLRRAYPSGPYGTLFPFRRLFFIARRNEEERKSEE